MKLVSFNRVSLAVVLLLATVIYSCQKEKGSNPAQEVSEEEAIVFAEESTEAEASFDDLEDISMQAADEESFVSAPNGRIFPFLRLRARLGPCAQISVTPDDSTYPKTVTIDFGNGCVCADGKFRKGAIILHFTGPIRRAGSVLTITLSNFYINRAHLEGTKVISNLSENGAIKFTVQVTGGKVTYPNGRGYKYDGLKYVAQIEGRGNNDVADDVYRIEGRSKTEFNNGLTVNLNTETPLIKKVACNWISDGLLKIKINDRVLFLNYGAPSNGDCDNKALLTWNNGNGHRLITLP
jgi:hypothetical protein